MVREVWPQRQNSGSKNDQRVIESPRRIVYDAGVAVRSGQGRPVEGDAVVATGTYYFQECPTCGRSLQIRVEYLGRVVVCQHCGGSLQARDPAARTLVNPHTHILERAEQLLQTADQIRTPQ
jgi:hypothetical protein